MMKDVFYLLCLASFLSCQSTTAREIAKYVQRPDVGVACIANGDGTCYEAGEIKDTVNMMCGGADKWNLIQNHLEDMEYFVWKCKRYGRCK